MYVKVGNYTVLGNYESYSYYKKIMVALFGRKITVLKDKIHASTFVFSAFITNILDPNLAINYYTTINI